MNNSTLKTRLLKWLRNHPGWIASGDLQRIVMQSTAYTAQNVGRRLRELENEGLIEVRYEKNHAYYRAAAAVTVEEMSRRQLAWFDALAAFRAYD